VASLALRERRPRHCRRRRLRRRRGGLLEFHPGIDGTWRDAAGFVDRILKGAPVGSLPITTVAERDLVVNQTTAEALGLTLSERFNATATRVIR
jgi:putative tryptophan/tyrosine transport system substrate-binding protein